MIILLMDQKWSNKCDNTRKRIIYRFSRYL